ncbi:MAG: light-harvesting antenna LH1, alpha subunit [Pseudomonadota bacterium]
MWRLWLLFDPRRLLIGLASFLFILAIVIHFILLSTARYNWLGGPPALPDQSAYSLTHSAPDELV